MAGSGSCPFLERRILGKCGYPGRGSSACEQVIMGAGVSVPSPLWHLTIPQSPSRMPPGCSCRSKQRSICSRQTGWPTRCVSECWVAPGCPCFVSCVIVQCQGLNLQTWLCWAEPLLPPCVPGPPMPVCLCTRTTQPPDPFILSLVYTCSHVHIPNYPLVSAAPTTYCFAHTCHSVLPVCVRTHGLHCGCLCPSPHSSSCPFRYPLPSLVFPLRL